MPVRIYRKITGVSYSCGVHHFSRSNSTLFLYKSASVALVKK